MKIPLPLKCLECKKDAYVAIKLSDQDVNWTCDCGYRNDGILGPNMTTGIKLLFRSQYELNEVKDFNLSIVFSAMAVDCELSRLFIKWEKIKSLGNHILPDNEKIEQLLFRYPRIRDKLKKVCEIPYPDGIRDFFVENPKFRISLAKLIQNFSPNTFYKDIEKNLFWRRNRIIHLGYSSFEHRDAIQCYGIANAMLDILNRLDLVKREQTS